MQYGNVIIFSLVTANKKIVPMGSLYDSLEYFMQIYEENKEIKLLFFILPYRSPSLTLQEIKTQLEEIILERYDINDLTFFDNIDLIDLRKAFFKHTFEKVLTLDLATPKFLKDFFIRAKEVFIVPEWTDSEYFYQSKFNKVTYYTEMPFCHSDVNYTMKMALSKLREFKDRDQRLYVNYPKGEWTHDPNAVEWIKGYGMDTLTKDRDFYFDLHGRFTEMIYFKTPYWFDPHPRLFHECTYYGKQFYYENPNNIKDGSYYRYHDALNFEIMNRDLTKDDELVRIMST